jgi:hypothetical protein
MALDSTISGETSNSYISVDDAQTYFDDRLNNDNWYNAPAEKQEQSLILATAHLERFDYLGTRVSSTQALKWPRYGVEKPDSGHYYSYLDATAIPKQVKDATCEMALSLLGSKAMDQPLSGAMSSLRIGPVSIDFKSGGWTMPPQVNQLLRGLRVNASGVPMVRA